MACVFVGRKPRSKERRPRLAAEPSDGFHSRLHYGQIAGDGASEVDRRHGSGAARLHPHDEHVGRLVGDPAADDLNRCAEIADSDDPLARGMCAAEVAWLWNTASRCPCSLPRDPNGQRRLSSFPVFSRRARPSASSIEAGLTEVRSRCAGSRSCPRNARPRLSSPDGCAVIPRGSRKSLPVALHFVAALRVQVDRLRSHDRHRGRDRRGPRKPRE